MAAGDHDTPVSPAGRFFLHPKTHQIINCFVGFEKQIDVEAMKMEIQNTLVKLHPRFSCILVTDKNGREHWRKVDKVDMDKHVLVVPTEAEESGGPNFVNEYVAGLSTTTLSDMEKPLWELHVLHLHKCCVLRLHHCFGDGISLMSLFLASCERADEPSLPPTIPTIRLRKTSTMSLIEKAWMLMMVAWYTFVYVLDFLLHILWVKDERTAISGGDGVELWPRQLTTVTFSFKDMGEVKNVINGTINDVLTGIISLGLERYLDLNSSRNSSKRLRLTGLAMVNTREVPGLLNLSNLMKHNTEANWGNRIGFILLPLYLQKSTTTTTTTDPLDHVRKAKKMLDCKKLSLEAKIAYKVGAMIMSIFGKEVAAMINYRIIANTTFTLSNLLGTSDKLMFARNPVTYIRSTSNGLPQAITMHMISYMDKADMQILVAKDIIQDIDVLAKCFEDALVDMKVAAMNQAKKDL